MLVFGDETRSRHHFEVKNTRFWRRDLFSSLVFDDETLSRHHFEAGNPIF
ncbi:hypothetical protein B4167_3694 [Caldibacillus thermoamylovorans]|uniref:Uncharacterized protein n=1 Tax=Caldibacillus thermoamylovorans TaxID=35841 RepID=A0ABD4A4I1_9BACI|nr:hypothetical protein B4167_3694 [Caldibacillus thermoamylovorans]